MRVIKIKSKKKEEPKVSYPFGTPILIPASDISINKSMISAFIIGSKGDKHFCYLTDISYNAIGGSRFKLVPNELIVENHFIIPDMIDIDKLCADIIRDLPDQWPEE